MGVADEGRGFCCFGVCYAASRVFSGNLYGSVKGLSADLYPTPKESNPEQELQPVFTLMFIDLGCLFIHLFALFFLDSAALPQFCVEDETLACTNSWLHITVGYSSILFVPASSTVLMLNRGLLHGHGESSANSFGELSGCGVCR